MTMVILFDFGENSGLGKCYCRRVCKYVMHTLDNAVKELQEELSMAVKVA